MTVSAILCQLTACAAGYLRSGGAAALRFLGLGAYTLGSRLTRLWARQLAASVHISLCPWAGSPTPVRRHQPPKGSSTVGNSHPHVKRRDTTLSRQFWSLSV